MIPTELVAVIDVGSNSIKLLVAGPGDPLSIVHQQTEEFRIGSSCNENETKSSGLALSEQAIQKATQCIVSLVAVGRSFAPKKLLIVATSSVREASNQEAFIEAIQQATGYPLRVLSGQEEAVGVAAGVLMDPALQDLQMFNLFDIGGGSLEMIQVSARQVLRVESLPLGAVRLTQACVPDPQAAVPQAVLEALQQHVEEVIAGAHCSAFPIGLPLVGTGGAMHVASRMLELGGDSFTVPRMQALLNRLASLSCDQRTHLPGLSKKRADIMPAALAVIIRLVELLKAPVIYHSLYNLRFGLAHRLLQDIA